MTNFRFFEDAGLGVARRTRTEVITHDVQEQGIRTDQRPMVEGRSILTEEGERGRRRKAVQRMEVRRYRRVKKGRLR